MNATAKPNLSLFMAIGILVICWRVAPQAGDDWQLWLLTGVFAAGGAASIISALSQLNRARGPRPRSKMPPLWLTAWIAAILLALAFGTPHLRIVYGPDGCFYAGWNGWQRHGRTPCPLIEMLPVKVPALTGDAE